MGLLSLFGGGGSQIKTRDQQLAEVRTQFPTVQVTNNNVVVPFTVPGNPQARWALDLPHNYPACGLPPSVLFHASLPVEHPLLTKGQGSGQQVQNLSLLTSWSQNTTLSAVLNALNYEFNVTTPGVHHPNEQLFIMTKRANEPMGCSFNQSTLVVSDVVPNQAAYNCGMHGFSGWVCVRINNRVATGFADVVEQSKNQRIVFNLRRGDGAAAPATAAPVAAAAAAAPTQHADPTPAVPQPQARIAPRLTIPAVPSQYNLDSLSLERLQTLSTNESALRGFLAEHEFTLACEKVVLAATAQLDSATNDLSSKRDVLESFKVEQEALNKALAALEAELTTVTQRREHVADLTATTTIRKQLLTQADEAEALSTELEALVVKGDMDPEHFVASRQKFHKYKTQANFLIETVS